MQANIIKDVINKIISINKDLNEESLINLLIASGWDKPDIEMGCRFFNQVEHLNIKNDTTKIDMAAHLTLTEHINEILPYENKLPVVIPSIRENETKARENETKVFDNKNLYVWINIILLAILLLLLAIYTMSFN